MAPSMFHALRLFVSLSLCLLNSVGSDFAADRAECAAQLVGLSTCLTFVEGDGRAPTPDCCSGLKQVLARSFKCVCVLIKDRNEPELGIKINVTRALSLPSMCDAPANVSDCPRVLKLPPNSTEAKVFEQFGNATKASFKDGNVKGSLNSTSGAIAGVAGGDTSGGGRTMRGLGAKMGFGLWTYTLLMLPLVITIGLEAHTELKTNNNV